MIFDLFFSSKGRLSPNKFVWTRLIVAALAYLTLLFMKKVTADTLFLGVVPYTYIYLVWVLILLRSVYALEAKRWVDMGKSKLYTLLGLFFIIQPALIPQTGPVSKVIFQFIGPLIYYLFLLFKGSALHADMIEERKHIIRKQVMDEYEKLGPEAFKKKVIKETPEFLADIKKQLKQKDISEDERRLLKALIENVEKAYNSLLEEEAEKASSKLLEEQKGKE